jgi:hypothetical protein
MVVNKYKKIGIITFHRSHNCGSVLQAYAMQRILEKKYNLSSEFINFSSQGQEDFYSVFDKRLAVKPVIKNLIKIPYAHRLIYNFNSYDAYINNKLKISSEKINNSKNLRESKFDYDIYVAGSDQIWNVSIQDSDDAYFLPFVHKSPKIAYAVSFGSKEIRTNTNNPERYFKMINDFKYISVREPNGQKWLKDGFNIDSELVLDPTLLLDKKDYRELEERPVERLEKNKYIFIYATELTRPQENTIRKLAKKEGLKIVVWQPDTWLKKFGWLKGYVLPKKQNPGKYLELMKEAKYVFTASFHGVIFAAQYRKNFWVLQNKGMDPNTDDRILSLLKRFGFLDRLFSEPKYYNEISRPVNYKKFEAALVAARKTSFKFLDEALEQVSRTEDK